MATSLIFEQAKIEDVPSIKQLVQASYELYIERIGREPAPMSADYRAVIALGNTVVASQDQEIVGLLVVEPRANYLLVENIAVCPSTQGSGVGSRLLDQAEQEARRLGLSELRLYTHVKMSENLDYYPRRGYRETERRHEDGFDRVYFSKRLEHSEKL